MMRTAVLMPNWIGDGVLALSVVERKRAQGNDFTLLAPAKIAPVIRTLSDIPIIEIPYERARKRKTLVAIRAARFDTICLLPYSFSSAWFALRCGIPNRRGLDRDGRRLLLTDPLPTKTRDYTRHILQEYCAVLEAPFEEPEAWAPKRCGSDVRHEGSIVLCPGASYGPAKRWEGFAGLASLLTKNEVVLLGSAGDAGECAGAPGILDLTGKTTLAEAAAIIAAARLVVANDSGLMHIAGYVGTPVVGLFGSTNPDWTRPLGTRVRCIHTAQPCSPCFSRACRHGTYHCLSAITPAEVALAIKELS